MLEAWEALPVNVGLLGKGNASTPEALREQVEAGACGLKDHEDWGTTPAVIDRGGSRRGVAETGRDSRLLCTSLRPELGRRTFLVPENHSEVLALLYHEQTGIVGGLPVGPVTTDPFGAHGIRMYPDQDPVVLEETRRYFEKLAERFSNDLAKA